MNLYKIIFGKIRARLQQNKFRRQANSNQRLYYYLKSTKKRTQKKRLKTLIE